MFNPSIPFKQIFDQYIFHPRNRYYLAAKLQDHRGGVGCLAFDDRCKILASGGDDEVVKIWSLQTFECVQTLADQESQWGQITALCFLGSPSAHNMYLCFGTGRGRLIVYQRNRMGALFTQVSHQCVFTNWDCIESISFSASKQRLVVTSQSGKIKLFGFNEGRLVEQWERAMRDAIARAVHFLDNGNRLQVFGLETGEVACFDTDSAEPKNIRALKTRIGDASICERSGNMLVDNLGFGFDLYAPNKMYPHQTYEVPVKRQFVKKAAFAEMGTMVICGSDHGLVYIYGIDATKCTQKLMHSGASDERVPVVETGRSESKFFIATGSRGKKNDICIWVKMGNPSMKAQGTGTTSVNFMLLLNIALMMIIAWFASDVWMPSVQMHTQKITTRFNGLINAVESFGAQPPRGTQDMSRLVPATRFEPTKRSDPTMSPWDEGVPLYYRDQDDEEWDEVEIDTL